MCPDRLPEQPWSEAGSTVTRRTTCANGSPARNLCGFRQRSRGVSAGTIPDGGGVVFTAVCPSRRPLEPVGALLVCLLAGCGFRGDLTGTVYRDGPVVFRIGALPGAWKRVQVADGQLAFHHADGGTIMAHATCEDRADVSLDVLTNHLLFGIDQRRELPRSPLSLDGRQGLRTRLVGTLDGVAVALELVVLKKDGCTYDFQLASSPQAFALRQPDFERFVQGFARGAS